MASALLTRFDAVTALAMCALVALTSGCDSGGTVAAPDDGKYPILFVAGSSLSSSDNVAGTAGVSGTVTVNDHACIGIDSPGDGHRIVIWPKGTTRDSARADVFYVPHYGIVQVGDRISDDSYWILTSMQTIEELSEYFPQMDSCGSPNDSVSSLAFD